MAKGFPTSIDDDGASRIADDEMYFRVSDVHPVAPPSSVAQKLLTQWLHKPDH